MTTAVVDLDAVRHNIRLLRRAAAGARVMAVVKANGFGHGSVEVAGAALAAGASWLGVTSLAEAIELRTAGIRAPILAWLHTPDDVLETALVSDLDLSVSAVRTLESLARAAGRLGRPAAVHLKADTGLSRGGATAGDWPHLLTVAAKLRAAGLITVRGVWSHLANAEDPDDPGLPRQLIAFGHARAEAAAAGLAGHLVHLANSAAVLQLPQARFDLVRPGIAVYGVEPVPGRSFGLRPAMTLESTVILTKRVGPGTGVSYGPDHVVARETTLALVPAGYADGVPRRVAGRAEVAVHGRRVPVVGRIAMDQIVLDVGDLPVRAGDRVVLFGPGDRGEPTVAEWAGWAETNPHEILTGIGPRVRRSYRGRCAGNAISTRSPSRPDECAAMTPS
ncbi:alanine racemase [Actinoplanes octamycinicus]|uniref:Alanine racemase n=1 Tax=Actinoplanes octamycinicus TaxID=135948 RepID=A0A7W7M5R3_9ACTN|nr:alanine racemase [Actinoplanes octamycinicus]MBB4737955.1 alanine racemase [Actinoplanes octamycinicus]GIE58994.1 alanine racemase [Actinoplanes octamycinicus]